MITDRKLSSIGGGVVTAFGFLTWMLSQMHLCDLKSLWFELPMLLGFLVIVPAWVRKANGRRHAILRCVGAIIFVVGLEMGYMSWLHTDYFPNWLLFPKPRKHQRVPAKPETNQTWMLGVEYSMLNVSPFTRYARA